MLARRCAIGGAPSNQWWASVTLEPLVTAEVDLVNMFGDAEWPCIHNVLRMHFSGASAWTELQDQSVSVTHGGRVHHQPGS